MRSTTRSASFRPRACQGLLAAASGDVDSAVAHFDAALDFGFQSRSRTGARCSRGESSCGEQSGAVTHGNHSRRYARSSTG